MNGTADVKKAIEYQKQYPELLRLRWQNLALVMLDKDCDTVNQISRMLGLTGKDKFYIYVNIRRLKYKKKVRRDSRQGFVKYRLIGKEKKISDYI